MNEVRAGAVGVAIALRAFERIKNSVTEILKELLTIFVECYPDSRCSRQVDSYLCLLSSGLKYVKKHVATTCRNVCRTL